MSSLINFCRNIFSYSTIKVSFIMRDVKKYYYSMASYEIHLQKVFCVFLKMRFFAFTFLYIPDFSTILKARKLGVVLNRS